jgi:hypothetical protein
MHIAAFTTALLLSMSFGFTVATCDYGAANNTILQNCLAATILAQGIALNIADQKNEQAALSTVKTLLTATPVDSVAFASAKANLLNFVNNGIAIRQMNQLITPPGNGAILGIAIVSISTDLVIEWHLQWRDRLRKLSLRSLVYRLTLPVRQR